MRYEKADTILRIALDMQGTAEGLSLEDIQRNYSDKLLSRRTGNFPHALKTLLNKRLHPHRSSDRRQSQRRTLCNRRQEIKMPTTTIQRRARSRRTLAADKERLTRLAEFGPIFRDPKCRFGKWHRATGTGSSKNPFTLP
ncbi:MAG TPA: hypothetical protein VIY09_07885, partial [Rhizomicrobium sp.]